ncbi:MAG: hypothetical protein AB7N80_00025 [Bdellovibrionales bacterium]
MLKLIVTILALLSTTAFADGSYSGTWRGKSYQASISETFDYVRGHWGEEQFDFSVSETFQYVRGQLPGGHVDITVSKTFSYVRGNLPCGHTDFSYSTTFKYIRGQLCGESFEINVTDEEEVVATARAVLFEELMADFPMPLRGVIRHFIRSKLEF